MLIVEFDLDKHTQLRSKSMDKYTHSLNQNLDKYTHSKEKRENEKRQRFEFI